MAITITEPEDIKYRIEHTLTGKSMVHYYCPKCRQLQKRKLGDAGHLELCVDCGGQHFVPGVTEKRARAQKIIDKSLAVDASRRARAGAPRQPRMGVLPEVLEWMGGVKWSSLLLLKAMCFLTGALVAISFTMSVVYHLWAKSILDSFARGGGDRLSEATRQQYYGLVENRTMFFLAGCYLTGFFATLLIGYTIAAAIDRNGRAAAAKSPS